MIFKIPKDIKFSFFYRKFNILSLLLVVMSVLILVFKGLNLGVDFKGGTLIELRTENTQISISEIRQSFIKMNLGDVTVKKFGKENDYLVKIELSKSNDKNFIKSINEKLSSDLGVSINFRRVENVGPKVSKELLNAGLLAAQILGLNNQVIKQKLSSYRKSLHDQVIEKDTKLNKIGAEEYLKES